MLQNKGSTYISPGRPRTHVVLPMCPTRGGRHPLSIRKMRHVPGPIPDTCLHMPCKISLSWLFKSSVLIILTMFLLSVYYCPILQMEK